MNTSYEWPLWESASMICGVDEAGRGPLAGPVVAAAVVFPRCFNAKGTLLEKLNDSKKLSPELRSALAPEVRKAAMFWAVKAVGPESIDQINILQATFRAMNLAIESLPVLPELLLIDGNRFRPALPIPFETIVKGDSRVFSIAAASVLAKTIRDEIMTESAKRWPHYGFERHFGYATKEHVEAIRTLGRCEIHRRSFRLRELGEK